jgi:hypothetical protein
VADGSAFIHFPVVVEGDLILSVCKAYTSLTVIVYNELSVDKFLKYLIDLTGGNLLAVYLPYLF